MSFYLSYCSSIFYLSTSASRLGSKGRAACLKTRTARLKCMKGPVCDKLDDGSLCKDESIYVQLSTWATPYTLCLCFAPVFVMSSDRRVAWSPHPPPNHKAHRPTHVRPPYLLLGWHGSSARWVSPKRCSLQRRFIFRNTTWGHPSVTELIL